MVSPFKAAIAADVSRVFINPAEFGGLYEINGVRDVPAVIDEHIAKERRSRTEGEFAEGVYSDERTVFVALKDLTHHPVKGEVFLLDRQRYLIHEVSEAMGILEILLRANET